MGCRLVSHPSLKYLFKITKSVTKTIKHYLKVKQEDFKTHVCVNKVSFSLGLYFILVWFWSHVYLKCSFVNLLFFFFFLTQARSHKYIYTWYSCQFPVNGFHSSCLTLAAALFLLLILLLLLPLTITYWASVIPGAFYIHWSF